MKKIALVMSMILVLLVGCNKETDAEKFKNEYESLNGQNSQNGKKYLNVEIEKDNIIKYVSISELLDVIKNETGVIYLGFPECPWCRNAVPALLEAANSTSIETIYYLNMFDVRDKLSLDNDGNIVTEVEGAKGYTDLLNALDTILDDYVISDEDGNEVKTGEKRIYVPLVIFVRDGEIVDYHADTVSSQTDPYVDLTNEEKNELINIYKEKINKITSNTCTDQGRC